MSDIHERNLEVLHLSLHQVFIDYLDRIKAQGVASDDINHAVTAYLEKGFALKFTASLTPQSLNVSCSVNEAELFNANLQLEKPRYQ